MLNSEDMKTDTQIVAKEKYSDKMKTIDRILSQLVMMWTEQSNSIRRDKVSFQIARNVSTKLNFDLNSLKHRRLDFA